MVLRGILFVVLLNLACLGLICLYAWRHSLAKVVKYKLGIYWESVYYSEAWKEYMYSSYAKTPHSDIVNQDDYCYTVEPKHRIYSDYKNTSLVAQVLENHFVSKKELSTDISIFMTSWPEWHLRHHIGRHFLCEQQRYNHIPGHNYLTHRQKFHSLLKSYFGNFPKDFMPLTLDLNDPLECLQATELLKNSSKEVSYITKTDAHRGKGIKLMNSETPQKDLCGNPNSIFQKYIQNPYLHNNHKVGIRVFMLIADLNPITVLYHDGFIQLAKEPYTSNNVIIS